MATSISRGIGLLRCSQPKPLFEQNKLFILIVNNWNDKCRTKHMDIRYDYVRKLVHINQIQVLYSLTTTMIADILTKLLDNILEKSNFAPQQ